MTTIYLVWVGEYSDARVLGAYSAEDVAERVAKQRSGAYSEAYVEECELDAPARVPPGLVGWSLRMTGDRQAYDICRCDAVDIMEYEERHGRCLDHDAVWLAGPWDSSKIRPNVRVMFVLARDEKHAVKIANERMTGLMLALGDAADTHYAKGLPTKDSVDKALEKLRDASPLKDDAEWGPAFRAGTPVTIRVELPEEEK